MKAKPTTRGGRLAVALFVFLLVVLIFLAYGQFRTNTEPGAGPGTPVSMLEQMDRGAA